MNMLQKIYLNSLYSGTIPKLYSVMKAKPNFHHAPLDDPDSFISLIYCLFYNFVYLDFIHVNLVFVYPFLLRVKDYD